MKYYKPQIHDPQVQVQVQILNPQVQVRVQVPITSLQIASSGQTPNKLK